MKTKENEQAGKNCMCEKEVTNKHIQNSINADKAAKNKSSEADAQVSDEKVEEDVNRINPDIDTRERG